ncbi:opacity protein-like surface antigen [Amorphus suaedae]
MHRHVPELLAATLVALLVSGGAAAASDVDADADVPVLQHTDDILPDEVERRGAYVRFDVGGVWSPSPGVSVVNAPAGLGTVDGGTLDAQVSVGGGVGYRFSNWFRSDLTVAYAPGRDFSADTSGTAGTGAISGSLSSTALLASAYAEFAPESWIRPYVGGGLGLANLSLDSVEQRMPTGGVTAFADNSEWNFAWSVAAGVTLDLSEAIELDAGYRYVNFGEAKTGIGSNGSSVSIDGIDSHELRFGVRYLFR